jgi:hypothetical protein
VNKKLFFLQLFIYHFCSENFGKNDFYFDDVVAVVVDDVVVVTRIQNLKKMNRFTL